MRLSLVGIAFVLIALAAKSAFSPPKARSTAEHRTASPELSPRARFDASGYGLTLPEQHWSPDSSLQEIAEWWERNHQERWRDLNSTRAASLRHRDVESIGSVDFSRALLLMSEGKPADAYEILTGMRALLDEEGGVIRNDNLASVMYFQGVASLRRGENENCIMCRGESSCILPISESAVHQNPSGSRQAIQHFMEYLEVFPDDLSAKWLLNLAHMTLGEYPAGVDQRFLLSLEPFVNSEFDIGRFRDVGYIVGCNRFNQAGGAIMEDFDGDGFLDLVVTSFDVKQKASIYRNDGRGRFVECGEEAGASDQLGGLNCVQADYNNDGLVDIFIIRGAWLPAPIRPTLLRNDGNLHFTDVTEEAGLEKALNSNSAQWGDYDNDGWVDLFVCCEKDRHQLYHNMGDGTFQERAALAGLIDYGQTFGKGCAWIDIDNDDDQDLYISYLDGTGQLMRNNGRGSFANASRLLEGGGASAGFSCWSWDFNNDGWMDIFATCYQRTLEDVVRGIIGQPHESQSNKLFLNLEGQGFRDVAAEMGLDMVFSTMGSNYADFDNDGFLDFYLGTGEPDLATLIPNRMFRNVGGERFAEITVSAGVGHLQKGHGVACGDWDRDGDIDLFAQLGGAIDGDKFHNALFNNPGQGRRSVTLQLTGVKTNRSAIGARIMLVTDGAQTIHRHVSSGSSFGANPLEQTIGLGDSDGIERIEVHWPASGTTQVFHDLPADKIIRITEFEEEVEVIDRTPIPLPEAPPAMQSAMR